MALISILLGLILDRHWKTLNSLRQFSWFETLADKVLDKTEAHVLHPVGRYLLVLAVPVVPVLVIQYGTGEWLSLAGFLFAVAVFAFCLGSLDIEQKLEQLIAALNDNNEAESKTLVNELCDNKNPAEDSLLDDLLHSLLNTAMDRLFSVIFWFAVLGPVGAVLYRFNQVLLQKYVDNPLLSYHTERMQYLLNWLPQRLLAMSFAITGHFEGALAAYKENQESELQQKHLLIDVAHGSLEGNDRDNKATYLVAFRGMILRSLIVWMACIALITLIGWN